MSQKKKTFARPAPSTPAGGNAAGGTGPMNLVLLEQLVKLMSENDLNTVDLREGTNRVILRRGTTYAAAPQAVHAAPVAATAPAAATAAMPAAPAAPVGDSDAGLIPIKSPTPGTFYLAPGPGQKPFVTVGAAVTEDSDVCIIEAMKVFNNIKADTKGTIAKIVAADGKPVEYGTVLFLVKP